jgi:hypothetical protein
MRFFCPWRAGFILAKLAGMAVAAARFLWRE